MAFIKLENVSVTFPIYSAGSRSLKNLVLSATTGGRIGKDKHNHITVHALDNVSMEISHGDRVGLIGHNGAGKTTLLRVLGGIYTPNQGVVTIEGKVTPMFDVSLGIDPEGTGYENIILRGLYLGLSRAEARRKTAEIAEFTELGEFLDLPVRTYSQGMQARLAFAMATSIKPDILLLDEGIGAGDAAFFLKANERLDRFAKEAGAVVLASHSEELIRKLCNKLILMEHGRISWVGELDAGFQFYSRSIAKQS
ncbi:MAG: lipopolysaccharide transport system ATP-binding protein [Alphaproteobacteria bacterium]|jgi:ABC-2 type transport system ATP-binding protein/lipopolysaccharide transport system ATP-binding protein|nr:lipopolysaccharide transport system ATP-binding protein [Alphaproteobacteria bacterium]